MTNQKMAGLDDNTSQQEVQAMARRLKVKTKYQTLKIHSKVQYQHEMDLSFPAF
jgi:hypothetical protein